VRVLATGTDGPKRKIREQAEVLREERLKLLTLTVHHSLKQSLQDEQERNGLAIKEFSQTITELEVELRRVQADPRISLAQLGFESRATLRIPKGTFKLSDLEAEGEHLAEDRNRILRLCGCRPIDLRSQPLALYQAAGAGSRPGRLGREALVPAKAVVTRARGAGFARFRRCCCQPIDLRAQSPALY
jgi:hypothetical protein